MIERQPTILCQEMRHREANREMHPYFLTRTICAFDEALPGEDLQQSGFSRYGEDEWARSSEEVR